MGRGVFQAAALGFALRPQPASVAVVRIIQTSRLNFDAHARPILLSSSTILSRKWAQTDEKLA